MKNIKKSQVKKIVNPWEGLPEITDAKSAMELLKQYSKLH